MTLRELRLWHWRKANSFNAKHAAHSNAAYAAEAANIGHTSRYHRSKAKAAKTRADWHNAAVAALNGAVSGDPALDEKAIAVQQSNLPVMT